MGDEMSDWVQVSSGVPQGSVLGPTLFAVFINDLPEGLNSTCKMFADDTKLIATIRPSHMKEDRAKLQEDIDKISEWCSDWHMCLNSEKCKMMSVGRLNLDGVYTIADQNGKTSQLTAVTSERDLGMVISRDLKPHDQACKAASTANRMLAILRNTFVSRDPILWRRLYTTYVRPHLEYASATWSPYTKKDCQVLEKVQRNATKTSHVLKKLSYEERLTNLGLTTLEVRRERGDLIQLFKIEKEIDKITWVSPYTRGPPRRGNRAQLRKETVQNCQQRYNFFSNRVVNNWNSLPESVVDAPNTNAFKNRLDKFQQRYNSSHSTDWALHARQ